MEEELEVGVARKRSMISQETLIPLGATILAVSGLFGGVLWLNNSIVDIRHGQEDVKREVESLAVDVKEVKDTLNSQFVQREVIQQWVELFKAKNPTINIPDFR